MINGINNYSNNNPYGAAQNINPYQYNDTKNAALPISSEQSAKARGEIQCKTCARRKYQDGSDDAGVSFQTPTNISPSRSGTAVLSHEREHYNRETAKASREGKKVISNTIKVFYSVCPECGRRYASGGETRTLTKSDNADKKNQDDKNKSINKFDATL